MPKVHITGRLQLENWQMIEDKNQTEHRDSWSGSLDVLLTEIRLGQKNREVQIRTTPEPDIGIPTTPKKTTKRFVPPTILEIQAHMGDNDESMKFLNFYDSKNWMVGKNKMVKWKSAASNWMAKNKPEPDEEIILSPEFYKKMEGRGRGSKSNRRG